jgi:hypothetical protein
VCDAWQDRTPVRRGTVEQGDNIVNPRRHYSALLCPTNRLVASATRTVWKGTHGTSNRPKVPGSSAPEGARSRPELNWSAAFAPLTAGDLWARQGSIKGWRHCDESWTRRPRTR